MKIYSNKPPESRGPANGAQNVPKAGAAEPTDRSGPAKSVSPPDRVNISDRGRVIADIKSAVNQLPDVRESKVAEIKKSVEAGTYTVDPARVAEAILKNL